MNATLKPPGKLQPPGKAGLKAPGKAGTSAAPPPPLKGGLKAPIKAAGGLAAPAAAEPVAAVAATPAVSSVGTKMPGLSRLMPQRRTDPPVHPKVMPKASGPATQPSARRPDQILEVVQLLSELLDVENAALRVHNIDKVRELAPRKDGLSRLYNDLMRGVAENAEVLAALDPERRVHLKTMAQKLQERVETNSRLLQANIDACNRVMRTVVEAVKEKRGTNAVYSAHGTLDMERCLGEGMALALDADF